MQCLWGGGYFGVHVGAWREGGRIGWREGEEGGEGALSTSGYMWFLEEEREGGREGGREGQGRI